MLLPITAAAMADVTPADTATSGERFEEARRAVAPPLLFGLRLRASVSLALYVADWLELNNRYWAGTSAAIACQPQPGASSRKGWFRMIGAVTGAAMSVVLVAGFPLDRILFLGGLAVWVAACAFVSALLSNFASHAAALAGYTAAIIAGDLFGAVGAVNAETAFRLAVTRASEICLGIVCAGIVLAGTDFGGARRRLGEQFADLSAGITAGFTRTLTMAGREFVVTQSVRREFVRRVVALDPMIDQTLGESAQIRYHSPVLQSAVDGLLTALSDWGAVANHAVGFGFGALSFRLLPPSSPAFRTHRRLALTLCDLRRLLLDRSQPDWQGHVYGRLTAMPDEATPLQRAQLVAALLAGSEIIDLRRIACHLGLTAKLDVALVALAKGHSARAVAQRSRLDEVLAADTADGPKTTDVLRARASILVLAMR